MCDRDMHAHAACKRMYIILLCELNETSFIQLEIWKMRSRAQARQCDMHNWWNAYVVPYRGRKRDRNTQRVRESERERGRRRNTTIHCTLRYSLCVLDRTVKLHSLIICILAAYHFHIPVPRSLTVSSHLYPCICLRFGFVWASVHAHISLCVCVCFVDIKYANVQIIPCKKWPLSFIQYSGCKS